MPVMWRCPGDPKCRKVFLYAPGLKAHMAGCKHARKKEFRRKREQMETLLSIIQFVADQQRGNITLARRMQPQYVQDPYEVRYYY